MPYITRTAILHTMNNICVDVKKERRGSKLNPCHRPNHLQFQGKEAKLKLEKLYAYFAKRKTSSKIFVLQENYILAAITLIVAM